MPIAATKPAIVLREAGMFRSPGRRKLVLGLLLVVATLALYNPVSRNGFVNFDDDRYVTDNPQVQAGLRWSTISWAFTSLDQANWHPLTWLSHALDCQLFGLNPVGHHYTNVLFHATNALLLFLILQWFSGYTTRSLMVAALFALHPLNVESVAWVVERKNVLSMFFFLLAVAAYGWYVRKPGIARYLAVAALFVMGLMSKPMVITLPLVLLLLDYWPLGRMGFPSKAGPQVEGEARFGVSIQPVWKLCVEKLPLLALSAGSAIMTMMAQGAGGAVLSSAAHDPWLLMEKVVVSYVLYVRNAVWPFRLAVLYPYPHAVPTWKVAASALVLLSLTLAVLKYRRHRYLVAGWLWFLGTMVPMIGLIQVGNQAMADRYAYLPMIGLFVMGVWAAAEWARFRQLSGKLLVAVGLTALLALADVAHIQLSYWYDDFTLWSRALAVTQNNFVAENNFGNALIRQGRPDDAIIHFRAAAALEPGDSASQLNLGIYAQEHGDLQQAAARYANALRLTTDTQMRASAYANLGTVHFALRDYAQAQQNFDSAMKLKHEFPVALLDLGLMAQKTAQGKDDWNRAADYYTRFVAVDPSDVGFLLLANALHQAGRDAEVNRAYQQAQSLSTDINQARQKAAQLARQ
ncbi:MAG: tetratricopeptide repeat protein [Acidobacteriia bacterium]|nr:tetratricopeptide repeat protein [Terriglobia bacterium]